MSDLKGYFLVLLSGAFFATAGIIAKYAYGLGVGTWELLTMQSLIASALLVIGALVFQPEILRVSGRQVLQLSVQGVFGGFATSFCFFMALQYLKASEAALLLYTYPALVTLGVLVFFKERPPWHYYAALVTTVFGVVLTVGLGGPLSFTTILPQGILLGLGAAAGCAFLNLYGQLVLKDVGAWTATIYVQLFSTAALLLIKPPLFFLDGVSASAWQTGILLATIASIIPFYSLLKGITLIGAGRASIVSVFELPVTMVLAWGLLGEKISMVQILGAVLIAGSVIFLALARQRQVQEHLLQSGG